MRKCCTQWVIILAAMAVMILTAACGGDDASDGDTSSDGDTLADGDVADGDISDGDTSTDGDTTDGDVPDGDFIDIDTAEADATDVDISDGDAEPDADNPTDGDEETTEIEEVPDGDEDLVEAIEGFDEEIEGEADSEDEAEIEEETYVGQPVDCLYSQCFPTTPTHQTGCYNDTGVIACPGTSGATDCTSTPFCGQDAQYPDISRVFTCYNAGGEATECSELASASPDEVVTDSITGLMWQRTLTEDVTWQEALEYCDELDYNSYTDWRLPNPHEINSLQEQGLISPAGDGAAFPNVPFTWMWTSLATIQNSNSAWMGFFGIGQISWDTKDHTYLVRCVRGSATGAGYEGQTHYTVSGTTGQEKVTDIITGLVWQKNFIASQTWSAALAACEGLDYAGSTDWRLPNEQELFSLVDYNLANPSSDFPGLSAATFWSSTTNINQPELAWIVGFSNGGGGTAFGGNKTTLYNALCVRGGL